MGLGKRPDGELTSLEPGGQRSNSPLATPARNAAHSARVNVRTDPTDPYYPGRIPRRTRQQDCPLSCSTISAGPPTGRRQATTVIWKVVEVANCYVVDIEPWNLAKAERNGISAQEGCSTTH